MQLSALPYAGRIGFALTATGIILAGVGTVRGTSPFTIALQVAIGGALVIVGMAFSQTFFVWPRPTWAGHPRLVLAAALFIAGLVLLYTTAWILQRFL